MIFVKEKAMEKPFKRAFRLSNAFSLKAENTFRKLGLEPNLENEVGS